MQLRDNFFLLIFICFIPLFQGVAITNCLISFKKFVFLTVVAVEMGKRQYFGYQTNTCEEDKILHQSHESFTYKMTLIKLR